MKITKTSSFFLALASIGFIIVVHEFGHFVAAKTFNVPVPVFSVGFGPALAYITLGETRFQIAAIPLGGYVSMNQEDLEKKPYWQKMIIILAGIFNNLVLALIIFIILFWLSRFTIKPVIRQVISHSPAAKAGLKKHDRIYAIDGKTLNSSVLPLLETIHKNPGQEITLTIERNAERFDIPITLRKHYLLGATIGYLGVHFEKDSAHRSSILQIFTQAINATITMIRETFWLLFNVGKPRKKNESDKPVDFFTLTSQTIKEGYAFFLFFMASVSIQIGIFNLLPIPLLDGGQAFQLTLYTLLKNIIPAHYIAIINYLFVLLLFFFLFAAQRPKKIK